MSVNRSKINDAKCPDFIDIDWSLWLSIFNTMDINNRITAIAFNVMLTCCTIFLNLLSVITIWKSYQLKTKICYFVILIQSLADLTVGAFSIPAFILFLASPLIGIQTCLFHVVLVQCFLLPPGLGTVTSFAMTIERYIGVLYPYSHQKLVTRRRILICVGTFSSIIFAIHILALHTVSVSADSYSVISLLTFLFIFYAYTRIYFVVRRIDGSEQKPSDIAQDQSKKRRLLRDIKHAKSCFIVTVCFAISLLPCGMYLFPSDTENTQQIAAVFTWSLTFASANSSLNSIIFFWTNRLLRNEAIAILMSCIRAVHGDD